MKYCLAAALIAGAALQSQGGGDKAQRIPDDYRLLYQQSFDSKTALDDFVMSDASAWTMGEGRSSLALELAKQSDYKPKVRSPFNIALIAGKQFSDFILEVDLVQTGREYGHRDMCLFFGFKDPSHYYYTHIATKADAHAHNVFIVNDAPRVKLTEETTEGVDWGLEQWHTVRLERNAAAGTIKVYFDDLEKPIMIAEDSHFDAGYIGFGSFDDTGKVDNIRVWGPAAQDQRCSFFEAP